MEQLPENMRLLRLFGADKTELDRLLAGAKNNSGIQLQCMEQGGESLVLLEAVTQSRQATRAVLDAWEDQIAERCAGALYATGGQTLNQTTVSLFEEKKMLVACVDAQTSALLEDKLGAVEGIDNIYDFGTHSHDHPKYKRKIALGSSFANKYPSQTAQQVAGQVKVAYHYSGADFVLGVLPLEDGSTVVIVGEKADYFLRRVPAGENAMLWAVDILRRGALGVKQAKGTIRLRYGAPMPKFAVVETIADKPEQFVAPEQSEFDAPPPPKKAKHPENSVFLAFALVCMLVLVAIAALYNYTGGDIASLWYDSGLDRFNVSSATLLTISCFNC